MDKIFSQELQGVHRANAFVFYALLFLCFTLLSYLLINYEDSVSFNSVRDFSSFYVVFFILVILSYRTMHFAKIKVAILRDSIEVTSDYSKLERVYLSDIEIVTEEGGHLILFCKRGRKVEVPAFGGSGILTLFRDEIKSMGIDYREFITT